MTEDEFEEYRMGHLIRTAEVWKRLLELGADEDSKLDFDFSFTAKRPQDAESLSGALRDYSIETSIEGVLRRIYTMTGSSGPIAWTEEQLIKWVDYLIAIGRENNCEFQGCGASAPDS
jgi:hypothetical protein